jgi:hypothetical protein
MALTCYTDVSGNPSDIVLSPATLISSAEKWIEFERHWDECLSAFGVSALHMRHFAHSRGEFESWRWNEPKRRRFLGGLLSIIEEFVDYTASVSVYAADYNRVDTQYRLSESMRPYTMGCLGCASRVALWAKETNQNKSDLIWVYKKAIKTKAIFESTGASHIQMAKWSRFSKGSWMYF